MRWIGIAVGLALAVAVGLFLLDREIRTQEGAAAAPGASAGGLSAAGAPHPNQRERATLSDPSLSVTRDGEDARIAAQGSAEDDDSRLADAFEFDEHAEPTRAQVRAAFETALARDFPDRRLSSDEIERATDSLMTLRETRLALGRLPYGPETAEERRILVERLGEAVADFEHLVDIDPAGFTEHASGGGAGIDRFDPNEPVPPAEFLETFPR